MAAKRGTTMSAREGPRGDGVNPMPETRVLYWILSDSDDGASSGKEDCAGAGAAKWARGLPHVCEHKCLATTKRCRGSYEEGVEYLISDSGNTTMTVRQVSLNLTTFLLVLWMELKVA
jgi:hypothetical protein